jgi:hypothetical protein
MIQREITIDVVKGIGWDWISTTREIAKKARHRNADVCAVLRSVAGCKVAFCCVAVEVLRTHKGYEREYVHVSRTDSLDLSREFADVIREVEADSRFGLFLGVEETAS